MKYIKTFTDHREYTRYKDSDEYITPNLSYCIQQNEAHFEKYTEPEDTRIIATFTVVKDLVDVQIVGSGRGGVATSNILEMEIDGVVQSDILTHYDFEQGEHVVKYTLKDNTKTSTDLFSGCALLTSVILPSTIETINQLSFGQCIGLDSITIPENVTSIMANAFNGCSSLQYIRCLPLDPPSLVSNAFDNTNSCNIYVPLGSYIRYKQESGWSDYTARIMGDVGL